MIKCDISKKDNNVALAQYSDTFEDILEELCYRSIDISIKNSFVLHEESISNILSDKVRFRSIAETSWSRYFIDKINKGMLGLSMESIYERKDYMDKTQMYYDDFLEYISPLLSKNNKIKRRVFKVVSEYFKSEHENKYKVLSVGSIGLHIGKCENGTYCPDLVVEFTVERK
jgi:hypothetical protein